LPPWKHALYVCCLLLLSKVVLSTCNARHLKLQPEFINLISRCKSCSMPTGPQRSCHVRWYGPPKDGPQVQRVPSRTVPGPNGAASPQPPTSRLFVPGPIHASASASAGDRETAKRRRLKTLALASAGEITPPPFAVSVPAGAPPRQSTSARASRRFPTPAMSSQVRPPSSSHCSPHLRKSIRFELVSGLNPLVAWLEANSCAVLLGPPLGSQLLADPHNFCAVGAGRQPQPIRREARAHRW
jgi:hypothetical protein